MAWKDLVALISPYAPEGRKGRPPFPVEMLHDMPLFRDFVGLSWDSPTPDESTILRFRHLLEVHKLC